MGLKIGRRPTRMSRDGDGINSSVFKPPLQFVRKKEIGEFALSISPLSIITLLAIEIIKVNVGKAMTPTADRSDASLAGADDEVKQETGESKMRASTMAQINAFLKLSVEVIEKLEDMQRRDEINRHHPHCNEPERTGDGVPFPIDGDDLTQFPVDDEEYTSVAERMGETLKVESDF